MRWARVGVVAIAVMATTGYPSEFGKDGRIGKAVHQDAEELVTERCSPEKIEEVCGEGKQHTPACQDCFK